MRRPRVLPPLPLTAHARCSFGRNPTLSYTQRLEERIKELEDQLAGAAQSPPASAAAASQAGPPVRDAHDAPWKRPVDQQCLVRSFGGLKVDDRGGITYHGTTSFFNLPSDRPPAAAAPADLLALADTDVQRRERLVNNAWQQRALENMSEIPVGPSHRLCAAGPLTV